MTLLIQAKPDCHEYLWNHFVLGFAYGEIAEAKNLACDNVRMKIGRCLGEVQSLVGNP